MRPRQGRKTLAAVVGFVVVGLIALSALASAEKPTTVRAGNLILSFDAGITPKALSKTTMEPVALNLEAKIATADGTHPAQMYGLRVHMDKNVSVDARGVPTCKRVPLQQQTTIEGARQLCKGAVVGTGTIEVEVASPGQPQTAIHAQLIAFNGGVRYGGTTSIFIYAFLPSPISAALVTILDVHKEHKAPHRTRFFTVFPPIAEFYGSVTAFRLTFPKKLFAYKGVKHGYLLAKCADGHFHAQAEAFLSSREADFTDETTLGPAKITRACTPKG
jgi:hypothetical protein